MRLSELVSALGLWVYPVVGLLGFLAAFAVVVARAFRAGGEQAARHAAIPLADGDEFSTEAAR